LQHSCAASTTFFGDPAVRITQVVGAASHNQITSICDTDYSSAMTSLGALIVAQANGTGGTTTGTTGGATTGTTGGSTAGTTGGASAGNGGCSGGTTGGTVDNVAACQSFLKSVQCGNIDLSMQVNCSVYSGTTCDLTPYFNCLEQHYVCVNGTYDQTKLSTINQCASMATCH
jgi:hypothetical protein